MSSPCAAGRLYACPACGRRFKRLRALKWHFRREHAPRTRCDACGKRFRNEAALFMHLINLARRDDEHAVLFFLMARRAKKVYREIERRALELLAEGGAGT